MIDFFKYVFGYGLAFVLFGLIGLQTVRSDCESIWESVQKWPRKFWRTIKFFYQRRTRGFDDSETWALDTSLSRLIVPRLKRFKELNDGFPVPIFETYEQWNEALDEIIWSFEWFANEERWNLSNEEEIEQLKRAEAGIQLFAKHFDHLWW